MIKDLYINKEEKPRTLIQTDDLNYDGKNLIIPAYWTSNLAEYLKLIDESKIADDDKEDLNTLKNFIFDVEYARNEGK